MKKYLNKKIIFGILVFIVFSGLIVLTSATWMDGITHFGSKDIGYHTKSGHTFELKDLPFDKGAYGQGYKVINNSGKDYFIPTKIEREWVAFKNHLPNGVRLENINKSMRGVTETIVSLGNLSHHLYRKLQMRFDKGTFEFCLAGHCNTYYNFDFKKNFWYRTPKISARESQVRVDHFYFVFRKSGGYIRLEQHWSIS